MPFRDKLRRFRKGSLSADNSPPLAGSPNASSTPQPSTGEATPAMTKTPTTRSDTDLATIGEVLTHQATVKAQAEAESKKKRMHLFHRKTDPYKDWPAEVYKPHEVPPSKYKRTPDPKHVENLSSFSFGAKASDFMRRLSIQSGVSPGGSRNQSRRGSRAPTANPSRQPSVVDELEDSGHASPHDKMPRPGIPNAAATIDAQEPIGEVDESDEISRQQTIDANKENKTSAAPAATTNKRQTQTLSRDSHEMPFSPQELTQALSKASVSH